MSVTRVNPVSGDGIDYSGDDAKEIKMQVEVAGQLPDKSWISLKRFAFDAKTPAALDEVVQKMLAVWEVF